MAATRDQQSYVKVLVGLAVTGHLAAQEAMATGRVRTPDSLNRDELCGAAVEGAQEKLLANLSGRSNRYLAELPEAAWIWGWLNNDWKHYGARSTAARRTHLTRYNWMPEFAEMVTQTGDLLSFTQSSVVSEAARDGWCSVCRTQTKRGQKIKLDGETGRWMHLSCADTPVAGDIPRDMLPSAGVVCCRVARHPEVKVIEDDLRMYRSRLKDLYGKFGLSPSLLSIHRTQHMDRSKGEWWSPANPVVPPGGHNPPDPLAEFEERLAQPDAEDLMHLLRRGGWSTTSRGRVVSLTSDKGSFVLMSAGSAREIATRAKESMKPVFDDATTLALRMYSALPEKDREAWKPLLADRVIEAALAIVAKEPNTEGARA